ncbi:MAG: hypothetical protein R3C40_07700 [Parvularculaceae bacterium]
MLEEFNAYAIGVQAKCAQRRLAGLRRRNTAVRRRSPAHDNPAADLAMAITGLIQQMWFHTRRRPVNSRRPGFSTVICGPGSIDQRQPNEYVSTLHRLSMHAGFSSRS